jgi:hypothetical protein
MPRRPIKSFEVEFRRSKSARSFARLLSDDSRQHGPPDDLPARNIFDDLPVDKVRAADEGALPARWRAERPVLAVVEEKTARRILPDLNQPVIDPVQERFRKEREERAQKRRPAAMGADEGSGPDIADEPRPQLEPDLCFADAARQTNAPAVNVALVSTSGPRRRGHRDSSFPPGERWKARLRHLR